MKVAIIAPKKHPELAEMGDFLFVLAQDILREPQYAKRIRDRPRKLYAMMDNGAFELGDPLEAEAIIEAAKMADADEIVLPDYPLKPRQTYLAVKEFFSVTSKKFINQRKLCVVPHGTSMQSYIKNLKDLVEDFPVDVIGWSIIDLYKYNYRARPFYIRTVANMHEEYFFGSDKLEHHLLGLDESLELLMYHDLPIRSVDTSLPISLAVVKQKIELPKDEVPHLRVPLDIPLQEETCRLAKANIQALLKIARRASSCA